MASTTRSTWGRPGGAVPAARRVRETSDDAWLQRFQFVAKTKVTADKAKVLAALGVREYVYEVGVATNQHCMLAAMRVESEAQIWDAVKEQWIGGAWKGKRLVLVGISQRQHPEVIPDAVHVRCFGPGSFEFDGPTPDDALRARRIANETSSDPDTYWDNVHEALEKLQRGDVAVFYNTVYYAPEKTRALLDELSRNGVSIYATIMQTPAPDAEAAEGQPMAFYPMIPTSIPNSHRLFEAIAVSDDEGLWHFTVDGNQHGYVHGAVPKQLAAIGRAVGGMIAARWLRSKAVHDAAPKANGRCFETTRGNIWLPNLTVWQDVDAAKSTRQLAGLLRGYYANSGGVVERLRPEAITQFPVEDLAQEIAHNCDRSESLADAVHRSVAAIGTRHSAVAHVRSRLVRLWWVFVGIGFGVLNWPLLPFEGVTAFESAITAQWLILGMKVAWYGYTRGVYSEMDDLTSANVLLSTFLFVVVCGGFKYGANLLNHKQRKIKRLVWFVLWLVCISYQLNGSVSPVESVERTGMVVGRQEAVLVNSQLALYGFQARATVEDPCEGLRACTVTWSREYPLFTLIKVSGTRVSLVRWWRYGSHERFWEILAPWVHRFFDQLAVARVGFIAMALFLCPVVLRAGVKAVVVWLALIVLRSFRLLRLPVDLVGKAVFGLVYPAYDGPFRKMVNAFSFGMWVSMFVLSLDEILLRFVQLVETSTLSAVQSQFPIGYCHLAVVSILSLIVYKKRRVAPVHRGTALMPRYNVNWAGGTHRFRTGAHDRVIETTAVEGGIQMGEKSGLPVVGGISMLRASVPVGRPYPSMFVYGKDCVGPALVKRTLVQAPVPQPLVEQEFRDFCVPIFDAARLQYGVGVKTYADIGAFAREHAESFTGVKKSQYSAAADFLEFVEKPPVESTGLKFWAKYVQGVNMTAFTKLELSTFKSVPKALLSSVPFFGPETLAAEWNQLADLPTKPRAVCFPKMTDISQVDVFAGLVGAHAFVKTALSEIWRESIVPSPAKPLDELAMDVNERLAHLDTLRADYGELSLNLLDVYKSLGHNPEKAPNTHVLGSTFCSKMLMLARNVHSEVVELAFVIPFDRLVARASCLAGDHGNNSAAVLREKLCSLMDLCQPSYFCLEFLRPLYKFVSDLAGDKKSRAREDLYEAWSNKDVYKPLALEWETKFWSTVLVLDGAKLLEEIREFGPWLADKVTAPSFDPAFARVEALPLLEVPECQFPLLHSMLQPGGRKVPVGRSVDQFRSEIKDVLEGAEPSARMLGEMEGWRVNQPRDFSVANAEGKFSEYALAMELRAVNAARTFDKDNQTTLLLYYGDVELDEVRSRASAVDVIVHVSKNADVTWDDLDEMDWQNYADETLFRWDGEDLEALRSCVLAAGVDVVVVVDFRNTELSNVLPFYRAVDDMADISYVIRRVVNEERSWVLAGQAIPFEPVTRWLSERPTGHLGDASFCALPFALTRANTGPANEAVVWIRCDHLRHVDRDTSTCSVRVRAALQRVDCSETPIVVEVDEAVRQRFERVINKISSRVDCVLSAHDGERYLERCELATEAGRGDLNEFMAIEVDAASCDGSQQAGNYWMQAQWVGMVCDAMPWIDRPSVMRVLTEPLTTEGNAPVRAWLVDAAQLLAALYSGLPWTTVNNGLRFVYASVSALAAVAHMDPERVLRSNLGVVLSTGDDLLVLVRCKRVQRPL